MGFPFVKKYGMVDCPILFLTAKNNAEHDITFGLGIGADDYRQSLFASGAAGQSKCPYTQGTKGTP